MKLEMMIFICLVPVYKVPRENNFIPSTRILSCCRSLSAYLSPSPPSFCQELFVRLVPYHCLGSLWSQRDKKGREGMCWSVRATVRQFNKLANAVSVSCLWSTQLHSWQRARLLEQWISVAEVSRSNTKSQRTQV